MSTLTELRKALDAISTPPASLLTPPSPPPPPSPDQATAAAASLSSLTSLLTTIHTTTLPHSTSLTHLTTDLRDVQRESQETSNAIAVRKVCEEIQECMNEGEGQAGKDHSQAVKLIATFNQLTAATPSSPLVAPSHFALVSSATATLSTVLVSSFTAAIKSGDLKAVCEIVPLMGVLDLAGTALAEYLKYFKALLTTSLAEIAEQSSPPVVKVASMFNAATTHLRHHLPMVSRTMGGVQGDCALLQVLYLTVEKFVSPVIDVEGGFGDLREVGGIVQELEDELLTNDGFPMFRKAGGGKEEEFGALSFSLKDLDRLTDECALLIQYSSSYSRFIAHANDEIVRLHPSRDASSPNILPTVTALGETSVELASIYSGGENALLLASILEAFKMEVNYEEVEEGGVNAVCTGLVEDLFFAVRRAVLRAVGSTLVIPICVVLNQCGMLLGTILTKVMTGKRVKRGVEVLVGSLQTGTEEERRVGGAVMNDYEKSMSYVRSLAGVVEQELMRVFGQQVYEKDEQLGSAVAALSGVAVTMEGSHPLGTLFESLRPTIKTLVENKAGGVSYDVKEEGGGKEEEGSYVDSICLGLEEHVGLKVMPYLSDGNGEALWIKVVGEVCKRLEMSIRRKVYTELGALKFDADVRSLSAWCKGVGVGGVGGGERLKQINRILNVYDLGDVVGVLENIEGGGGLLLKKSEVRGYLTLKAEFSKEDVDFVVDRLVMQQ